MSVSMFTTVMTVGMSMDSATILRFRLDTGAFSTAPMAPWLSTSLARVTVRSPLVVPPPMPQNTGMEECLIRASLMDCWGVKGYTANTASASQFLIMARSVVKARLLIRFP